MAERLAPERAPVTVLSTPERPRGSRSRWARRLLALVVAAATLMVGALVLAHFLVVDRGARQLRASALIPEGVETSVLVVVARPGQEVLMAGTLRALDEAGARVSLLALTSGEAQPPDLQATTDGIGPLRMGEFAAAAERLGVESATAGALPDGELVTQDPSVISAPIVAAIEAVQPAIILTVADATGEDTDTQVVAAQVLDAARAEGSLVTRVWTVTRGQREADWLALLGGPAAHGEVLPHPEVSIHVDRFAAERGDVLAIHGTQSPDLVAATYPYADRIPAWAYFRFLDREYFDLTWGEPLD